MAVAAGGGTGITGNLDTAIIAGENEEEDLLGTSPKDNEELFTSLAAQKGDGVSCRG